MELRLKRLAWFCYALVLSLPCLAPARPRIIRCEGEVSMDHGTFRGRQVVIFSSTRSGSWYLHLGNRLIEGGTNLSHEDDILILNKYVFSARDGVRASYDWNKHRLKFRFKYHEGSLGGGHRWTAGVFHDCEEFEDELPKRQGESCMTALSLKSSRP